MGISLSTDAQGRIGQAEGTTMIDAKPSPNPGQSPEQRLSQLQKQLEEKEKQLLDRDRIVKDLTQRLSQTVEKLDRVQRVGSDRTVISTATFPKEVVEQQSQLVEDLQRAVELWENMQLGVGLGKLEMQLSDLRELLEEQFHEEEPEPEPAESSEASDEPCPEGESADEAEIASLETQADDAMETLAEEWEQSAEEIQEGDDVCPIRPPEILNLAEAREPDLRRCVEQQDTYIDYLSARLKRVAEKQVAVDWQDLSDKPEKLRIQLEGTANKLQQSRHLAEFELALQRTRLKRKERELATFSEELAVQMQTIGLQPDPDTGKETPGGGRWMRMLGMGKKESE
jgi:predicted DNA-binding protein